MMREARCLDCGLPYEEHGLDLCLPLDQWSAITGEDGIYIILCGTCISRRAAKIIGANAIRAVIAINIPTTPEPPTTPPA